MKSRSWRQKTDEKVLEYTVKAGTKVVRLLEKRSEAFFYPRLYLLTFIGITQNTLGILLQVHTYKSV